MKQYLFAFMLLLASFSFAWNAGFTPPSCATTQSVLGVNFVTNIPASCPSSTGFLQGNVTAAGQYYNLTNATHIRIGKDPGTTIIDLPFPTSGNYSGTTTASATTNKMLACDGGSIDICGASPVNFTQINSTHYLIAIAGANVTCTKSQNWSIAFGTSGASCSGGSGSYLELPIWNTSTTKYLSFSSNLAIDSTQYYIGALIGNSPVFSDFKTGASLVSNASFCQATLYYNGNQIILPSIYYDGTDAFGNFYSALQVSYIRNNTQAYVYDSSQRFWFSVPAFSCNSFSTLYSIPVYLQAGAGTITGTGGIPYGLSGNVSATCNFASPVISCIGTDVGTTITGYALLLYTQGNSTAVCANGSAGSTASLSCTLPANGSYIYQFNGYDALINIYPLASGSINYNTTATGGMGRNGWLALLVLFVVIAMVGYWNLALSMVLGGMSIFIGILMGLVPVSESITIAITFVVLGFVLAYRLKL